MQLLHLLILLLLLLYAAAAAVAGPADCGCILCSTLGLTHSTTAGTAAYIKYSLTTTKRRCKGWSDCNSHKVCCLHTQHKQLISKRDTFASGLSSIYKTASAR